MSRGWRVGAVAVLLLGVLFAVASWLVGTDARPATAETLATAWSRVHYMLSFPLRMLAFLVFGGVYMRHAHGLLLVLAAITPLFWFAVFIALRAAWQYRPKPAAPRLPEQPALTRRVFLASAATGVAGLGGAAMGGDALLLAPQRVQLRSYRHAVPWLPDGAEALRIAHVSDTHLGPYVSRRYLEGVMAQVNALSPDFVFLTGDYVHRHPSFIEDGIGLFSLLRPRIGTVAVLGNHDHWEGADACRRVFAKIGIPVLDNARLFLSEQGLSQALPSGRALCIAGLGDYWEDAVERDATLHAVPPEMHRIVLSHNPDTALLPGAARIDLMVSGHTHGGQVSVPFLGAPFVPSRHGDRFLGGECEGDGFPVIVSRGLGLAGIPMRFRVPPELGLIELRRSAAV